MKTHPLIEAIQKTSEFSPESADLFLSIFEEKSTKKIQFFWNREKWRMRFSLL